MNNRFLIAALLLTTGGTLHAQLVGHTPAGSPYRDVQETMELTLMTGHFTARPDAVGIVPQGGDMWTLLYGWHAKGPLFLTGSMSRIESQRRVLDPYATTKDLGIFAWPMMAFDGMMSLSLTGDRTYHGFMPLLNGGMGVVSDGHTSSDVGNYGFGSRFEFLTGVSLRYIPAPHWAIRADFTDRYYSSGYPQSYYVSGKDGFPIVSADQDKRFWRINPSFTIGFSYLFSH